MKFTDGYWCVREGYSVMHPHHLQSWEKRDETVEVLAPFKSIEGRADTLNLGAVTISFSFPAEGVIRTRIEHFRGVKSGGPNFELSVGAGTKDIHVEETADALLISRGDTAVRVRTQDGWNIEYMAGGKVLTSSPRKGIGYVTSPEGLHYIHEELSLGVGELVYGLGERFSAFVKNGQVVDIWNRDGGTSSDQAYKNIPFYLTNRGYGVFINHPGRVSLEVASEKVSRTQFSVPGEAVEYFIISGTTPKEVLTRYTTLTGRPALPPRWSFGLWLTTSFTTSYDEETVNQFIDGMVERDIPLHVFHFDTFWMKEFHWCNFLWDTDTFPDPLGMVKRLKEKGIRVSLWINPYIAQASEVFEEAAKQGFLLKRKNGDIWQTDMWQAGMGIVDFTNPAAADWFAEKLKPLFEMGVDSIKSDFGERIPTDVMYFDGSDPERMHNYYAYLYNKVVFRALEEHRKAVESPDNRANQGADNVPDNGAVQGTDQGAVLFARAATAGSQKFPVHWGGDCESAFESMAESLRGGLSLGMSGFGFWSHDIGGFEGTPPAGLFKRWIAFGMLSSHSRLHGSKSYRVPWLVDEESVKVLRFFSKLKCTLLPYIYQAAIEASLTGVPVMRAMLLEFPDDRTCEYLDRQYMLGASLLVAPVFSDDGDCDFYLPRGSWKEFFSGRIYSGERWYSQKYDVMSLPLFIRENSAVPLGASDSRTDYDFRDGLRLLMGPLTDNTDFTVSIPTGHGTETTAFSVSVGTKEIEIRPDDTGKTWSLQLSGYREKEAGAPQFFSPKRPDSILKVPLE